MLAPLLRRKSHALLSLSALALGACLVTTLLTLYRGVQPNLSRQFRRYGANAVATPWPGSTSISATQAQPALQQFSGGVGLLYTVGTGDGQPLVIAGANLAALLRLNTEWQVRPQPQIPGMGEAWLGANAARLLRRGVGDSVAVTLNGHAATWRVAGIVQAGTADDNQLFAPYPQVAQLAETTGFTTLQFRLPGAAMAPGLRHLRQLLPGAEVQPVLQIAASEVAILLSTRSMMVATTSLILATVGLCVAAALTTLALERRRDFGLMKALGGSDRSIMAAFIGEAALLACTAAIAGIALGALLAGAMGRALFGTWMAPPAGALLAAAALTVALACLAALLPWPIVRASTPAAILRGE